jgi:acyl-CoA thioesterase
MGPPFRLASWRGHARISCGDRTPRCKALVLERLSIEVGQAAVAMIVLPSMVNGLGITHGGAIFTLADSVFALACNTYNERTISAHCSISLVRPTRLGDRLVAVATEVVRSGRSGIYDVRVTLEESIVAEFRAHSHVIGGALLPVNRDNLCVPKTLSVLMTYGIA